MKIRLLKNHPLGKRNDVIDVPYERANYLVRMKVAEVSEEKAFFVGETVYDEAPLDDINNFFDKLSKEKNEVNIQKEKESHEGLPTAKKRARKSK